MSEIVAFLTDPRLFLVPVLAAVPVLLVWAWRGAAEGTWRRLWDVEAILVPATFGMVYGPQWLSRLIRASGGSVSLNWDSVITTLVLLVALTALVFSIRQFSRLESMRWIAAAVIAYNLGTLGHVIVTGGEPFVDWFGVDNG